MSVKKDVVKVSAPAIIGNVCVGFDLLGLAIKQPTDTLIARKVNEKGLRITKLSKSAASLPRNVEKNTASVAVMALLSALKQPIDHGIELELKKGIPIGGGLGGSAASACAAVFAVNELLGRPFETNELIPFAMEGEKLTTNNIEVADNVVPCLLGGMIMCQGTNAPQRIYLPKALFLVVMMPNIKVETALAREQLPKSIDIDKAVNQMGYLANFVKGCITGDYNLMRDNFIDEISEPYRKNNIPGFDDFQNAALKIGALGCSISGSGPAVFAICENTLIAENVQIEFEKVAKQHKLSAEVIVTEPNHNGIVII